MRTIYLDCGMGAAGDMLMAALLELHPNPDRFLARINQIGLPGVHVTRSTAVKCGIQGTAVHVTVNHEQETTGAIASPQNSLTTLKNLEAVLTKANLPEQVLSDAIAVYRSIAAAESAVHGIPVEQVHFHELGMLDAVTDIVGVCMLLHDLAPAKVIASPVNVGTGQVKCAHGLLPIPAPATTRLLEGIPVYSNGILGELCTPTGAALLKQFVSGFTPMPTIKLVKTGYGMGKKDFPAANCIRAMLGETDEAGNTVAELCCNLDDMTPEAIGFAMEMLLEAGALDVFTTPIGMKKCRPGILLTCLCHQEQREEMVQLLFRHTTTLGIRERQCHRYLLERSSRSVQTKYGTVRVKQSDGWGFKREKIEYEDVARIAREQNASFSEVTTELAKYKEKS